MGILSVDPSNINLDNANFMKMILNLLFIKTYGLA